MIIRIDRIDALRKRNKLSTVKLANIAGCTTASYYKYQNENAPQTWTMECLCNVADYFGCDLDYLLDRQECETKEITDIQKATGLSEMAIQEICNRPEYHDYILNSGNDFGLALEHDSLNWCITHGLLDIIDTMHNIRTYGCLIRRSNISKELQNLINNSFIDASESDIHFQMDDIRCFVNSLIKSLSKYDIEKLSKFKDELCSLPHQEFTHVIDESDKKDVNDEIELFNNVNGSLNKESQKMIYYISLYVLQFCYPALYFNYTLETSKFTISKKFNALVDDYVNQFINQKGDEK